MCLYAIYLGQLTVFFRLGLNSYIVIIPIKCDKLLNGSVSSLIGAFESNVNLIYQKIRDINDMTHITC